MSAGLAHERGDRAHEELEWLVAAVSRESRPQRRMSDPLAVRNTNHRPLSVWGIDEKPVLDRRTEGGAPVRGDLAGLQRSRVCDPSPARDQDRIARKPEKIALNDKEMAHSWLESCTLAGHKRHEDQSHSSRSVGVPARRSRSSALGRDRAEPAAAAGQLDTLDLPRVRQPRDAR